MFVVWISNPDVCVVQGYKFRTRRLLTGMQIIRQGIFRLYDFRRNKNLEINNRITCRICGTEDKQSICTYSRDLTLTFKLQMNFNKVVGRMVIKHF